MTAGRVPGRETLPIPDRPRVCLTTYDAKDPETSFPPIEPLRPPEVPRTSSFSCANRSAEERLDLAMGRQ